MAQRNKPRVVDWRPDKSLTFYHHKPAPRPERRTTPVGGENPFYEGIGEAMRGGARTSKKVCEDRAWNGCPHPEEVAVDRRIQASERVLARQENDLGKLDRRIECDLAALERRLAKQRGNTL